MRNKKLKEINEMKRAMDQKKKACARRFRYNFLLIYLSLERSKIDHVELVVIIYWIKSNVTIVRIQFI